MHIEKVRVEGFRLLEDVEILLEPTATVIVGRNNSGKTSLTEVFDRFAGDKTRFRLEDFSSGISGKFLEARRLRHGGMKPEEVLDALPSIAITLTFRYDATAADLGPLAPFIIDLDPASTAGIIRVEYAPTIQTLQTLFGMPDVEEGVDDKVHFYRNLRDTIPASYSVQVTAIDPTDATNTRTFDSSSALDALIQCGFVRAQRTLDHAKQGDPDVIGKLLGTLFKTATSPTAAASDQQLAAEIKASVGSIEKGIQTGFDSMIAGLLPALEVFGFPSLNDTKISPETSLDVESLLSDHTKIVYLGEHGVHLPEGYNGLGTRNLIYMLLQLESYHKAYRARPTRPGTHLIFIEEPEAHLHPQMQEVFIKQLTQAVEALSAKYKDEPAWQVQFIVSTHSSHVANAATFESVRYFLSAPPTASATRHTKVKDFKKGLDAISPGDKKFLQQYMTLTKCDLYFADKAIIVEGTTERILMPRLCKIVDKYLTPEAKLARQYVTTIEIGGAHSHLFYPLVDFLELKTLVITDLDAARAEKIVNKKGNEQTTWVKCPVADGERCGNAAIKSWFGFKAGDVPLADVIKKKDDAKIQGSRRIAFQIPEEGSKNCARSYEDALILANLDHFGLAESEDPASDAWDEAQDWSKAEKALEFAILEDDWNVPLYIRQGLVWLSEPPPPPPEPPVPELNAVEEAV